MTVDISTDELLGLLGAKDAEIFVLRKKVIALELKVQGLESQVAMQKYKEENIGPRMGQLSIHGKQDTLNRAS